MRSKTLRKLFLRSKQQLIHSFVSTHTNKMIVYVKSPKTQIFSSKRSQTPNPTYGTCNLTFSTSINPFLRLKPIKYVYIYTTPQTMIKIHIKHTFSSHSKAYQGLHDPWHYNYALEQSNGHERMKNSSHTLVEFNFNRLEM